MRVRFVKDYYGERSGFLFFAAGNEGDLQDAVAEKLIAEGFAEPAALTYPVGIGAAEAKEAQDGE